MKHSRNWRRDKADKLYQQKLLVAKPKCLACSRPAQVIHHYHPKSISNRLRYDEQNGAPLCHNCHFAHHIKSDPSVQQAIDRAWGQKRLDYLQRTKRELVKTDKNYYEQAIKKLSQ